MKRLLASTAILLVAASPLAAQSEMSAFMETSEMTDMTASDLIGQRLYVDEVEMTSGDTTTMEMRGEWDDVGEIGDLLVSQEGEIKAALLDIGGFLGIGERRIAVNMGELRFLTDQDDPTQVFIAVTGTQESLEGAPEFLTAEEMQAEMEAETAATETEAGATTEPLVGGTTTAVENNAGMTADEPVEVEVVEGEEPVEGEMVEGEAAMEPVEGEAAMEPVEGEMVEGEAAEMEPMSDDLMLTRPAIEREGYMEVTQEELTAEMLTGAAVYGMEDESIGEVSDLVMGEDGQVSEAVIDVGGFLGMGENPVAVSFDEMQIIRDEAGEDVRVYIEASQEKLEQRPTYEN